ncbi:DDE-type integrase/transposase/recombinase [Enterococcus sp. BWM-S5]|uniref:DDE-type integrase/transposase/recombinase n=1 Tax=Enterococcus larvae TaxID=2794352 RepID=A0ABS4CEF4_9ENTE|nr:DDE-type integrase/transposase/recombinase [Enterococcus larvae]
MTYILLQKGTLYIVVLIDVYTRKIVGWAMSPRMKDQLIIDAFLQACEKEQPQAELIVHMDQGSQHRNTSFQSELRKKLSLV